MDNYKIIEWTNGLLWLKFDARHIEEGLLIAKEKNINNFICDFHQTDNVNDLSFLNSTIVRGLNVTFSGLKSNAELNDFSNLQILISLYGQPVTLLDFSKLLNIEELEITYNQKIIGLSKLINLRELRLWKYKAKAKNLEEFQGCIHINKMMLVQPTISSLDGIQGLTQLTDLEIVRPKGLTVFLKSAFTKGSLQLQRLVLSFCKEIDFASIPTIQSLISLTITDSGKINSIRDVVERLPNLKVLTFTRTELLDGNLDYLIDHPTLEKVIIDHKKHYNMREKEINSLLAEKRE